MTKVLEGTETREQRDHELTREYLNKVPEEYGDEWRNNNLE